MVHSTYNHGASSCTCGGQCNACQTRNANPEGINQYTGGHDGNVNVGAQIKVMGGEHEGKEGIVQGIAHVGKTKHLIVRSHDGETLTIQPHMVHVDQTTNANPEGINQYSVGDSVKVGKGIGSKLEDKVVKVTAGPYKVGHVSGVYRVKHDESGHEEEVHGSRLSKTISNANPEGINQYSHGNAGSATQKAADKTEAAMGALRSYDALHGMRERLKDPKPLSPEEHEEFSKTHESLAKYHSFVPKALPGGGFGRHPADQELTDIHRKAADLHFRAQRTSRTDNKETAMRKSIWNRLGEALGITGNADQSRHLESGQFLNKVGSSAKQLRAAAQAGARHYNGHEQAPEADPDDDDDLHPSIGQGDREADELDLGPSGADRCPTCGEEEPCHCSGHVRNEDEDENEEDEETDNCTGMIAHNLFKPEQLVDASKKAADASMSTGHGEAIGHGGRAYAHAKGNDGNQAIDFHTQAAEAHDGAAMDAHKDKEPALADTHLQAAMLHRRAAAMHTAAVPSAQTNAPSPLPPQQIGQPSVMPPAAPPKPPITVPPQVQAKVAAQPAAPRLPPRLPARLPPAPPVAVPPPPAKGGPPGAGGPPQAAAAKGPPLPAGGKPPFPPKGPPTGNRDSNSLPAGSNFSQGEPMFNRSKALAVLTRNCRSANDKAAFNALSDETLEVLVVNAKVDGSNADSSGGEGGETVQLGGEEDGDAQGIKSDDDDMPEDVVSAIGKNPKSHAEEGKDSKPTGNTMKKWLAGMPAEAVDMVSEWQRVTTNERQRLARTLKEIVDAEQNPTRKELILNKLKGRPNNQALRDLIVLLQPAPTQNQEIADPLASVFMGAQGGPGGPVINASACDDPLDIEPMDYKSISSSKGTHNRKRNTDSAQESDSGETTDLI